MPSEVHRHDAVIIFLLEMLCGNSLNIYRLCSNYTHKCNEIMIDVVHVCI